MEGFEKNILGQDLEAVSSFAVHFQTRILVMAYERVCVWGGVHCFVSFVMCNLAGSF